MGTYHGRRGPNVSQYLANLNTIPTTHDLASDINIADPDLEFLTNAEFFDFDSFNPNTVDLHHSHSHSPHDGEGRSRMPVNGPQYQFGEFQTYPTTVASSPASAGLHGQYPPQPNHHIPYGGPNVGDKRKASIANNIPSPADLEEQGRAAAEEDKRRRNTAASARFRVKKKQREQALEKQAKEMTEKVQQLEGKVQQLEMENKWLKGLITDKNDGKSLERLQAEKESDERKPGEPKRGVGTLTPDEEEEEEYEFDDEDVKLEA